MSDPFTALRLFGGIVLLLSNGYFVTTEFAMTRVRQFDEEQFTGWGLERAWEMTDRLEIYLSGCQLGITISSVGLGVVAEPALAAVLDPLVVAVGLAPPGDGVGHATISVIVAFGLINLLHVIVGEQAPTYLGIERTRTIAKYGAPVLYWWTTLTWPVIAVADRTAKWALGLFGVDITRSWVEEERADELPSSRAELKRRMGEELRHAGLSAERSEEVINALAIGDTPVEDVMVDRTDVVALSSSEPFETNYRRMREHLHDRYPLVGDDLGDVEGVVYTPGLLDAVDRLERTEVELAEVAAPPMVVDATTPISEVIDRFQAENQDLAMVRREGETVGLVTARDCLEAITGELQEPVDKRLLRDR